VRWASAGESLGVLEARDGGEGLTLRAALVYSPGYDLSMFGLERLHPFDGRKYSKAWGLVTERLGDAARRLLEQPLGPAEDADLLRVHTREHLDSLRSAAVVAGALELPLLRFLPASVIARRVLRPMRLAVAGTIVVLSSIVIVSVGGCRPRSARAGKTNAPRKSTSLSGDAKP
jgi:hypothetical protein